MNSKGFTLLELIVTLTVMSILVGLAIPFFGETIKSQRIATQRDRLFNTFVYARSEAVKLGKRVTVCTSSDGATCSGGAWNTGWIVFIDFNGNAVVDSGSAAITEDNDRVLRIVEPSSSSVSSTTTAGATITYTSEGRSSSSGNFVFSTNDAYTNHDRGVEISATGRPKKG